ncbi:MAG: HDOD domain-containing protein, partial [Pseudoxanthomonas sp.]
MPATLFLLAGVAILVVVGLLVWSRRRSPASDIATQDAPAAELPQAESMASLEAMPGSRELLHRLHSVAFEDAALPGVRGEPAVGHADITSAAGNILSKIETQPRYTPRRPQLLPQLMRTVNDPDASGQAIAAIIGQDPALAGNLIRIASSALYRVQSSPVESIERAVALVGTDGIRQIITAALVQPVMSDGGGV